jgi:hypothetical protein
MAKGEQGRHESKNTLAKSHAILLRLFEASAPSRETCSLTALGRCFGKIFFRDCLQRKGGGPLDYSNRETRQSDRAGAKGANDGWMSALKPGSLPDNSGVVYKNFNSMVGGTSGLGIAFAVTPSGAMVATRSFSPSVGASPIGGVIQATDGTLFGTASVDGTVNGQMSAHGTVYMITGLPPKH